MGTQADADAESAGGTEKLVGAIRATYVGVSGFVAILVWQLLLFDALSGFGLSIGPVVEQVVGALALGLGTGTVVYFYLRWSSRSIGFVDVRRPTRRDVGYAVGGAVVLFVLLAAFEAIFSLVGVSIAEHDVRRQLETGDPTMLLALIPASWLLIGPGEELLYRNVVQKSLYDTFSRRGAIAVASVVFALVHVPAYGGGAGADSLLGALVVIFALSLVLGVSYDRTRNVIVPAFIHGTYDAVLFALLYVETVGPI